MKNFTVYILNVPNRLVNLHLSCKIFYFNFVFRVIEGVYRSINNLLERFHQSYFFYLLADYDRFISIGNQINLFIFVYFVCVLIIFICVIISILLIFNFNCLYKMTRLRTEFYLSYVTIFIELVLPSIGKILLLK